MERGPAQFTFSVNGKGFEIDPEPILLSKLQSPSSAANFDRFVETVRKAVDGEEEMRMQKKEG